METFGSALWGVHRLKTTPGNRRDEASAEDDFLKDADLSSGAVERTSSLTTLDPRIRRKAEGCTSCHILATAWWYLWPEIWPKTLGGPQTDHGVGVFTFLLPSSQTFSLLHLASTLPVFLFFVKMIYEARLSCAKMCEMVFEPS